MISGSDIALLLALFRICDNSVSGRKRLQKMVCILKFRYGIPFSFSFKPYFYGPYSEELSDLVETMKSVGILNEVTAPIAPGIVQYRYNLTAKGVTAFQRSRSLIDKATLQMMERKIGELNDLPTRELVILSKQQVLLAG